MMDASTALVITSIASPNAVLRRYAQGCQERGMPFILIGDRSSPPDFQLEGCAYFGLDAQTEMPFALAKLLPERHYARKNLGYLEAIRRGATTIVETDDDNAPTDAFWAPRTQQVMAEPVAEPGWVNVYRHFSDERIWPRGFALERLQDPVPGVAPAASRNCPVQQGLADGDPDVDAIYRLTGLLPVNFSKRAHPVSLPPGSWCPFNSQNTTWFAAAFPLLYLPAYCSFRMTDIWRSFVALRIMHANDWQLLFHNATVWQDRNAHDLMRDMGDELVGYRNNLRVVERLAELEIVPGSAHLLTNLRACYSVFIDMGLVDAAERPLLDAWCTDMERLAHTRP